MKITDLLNKNGIDLNFDPKNKDDAINKLTVLMNKTGALNNEKKYREAIIERESLSTTGIGDGIAIPHGKTDAVNTPQLAAAVCKNGVDYDALDGAPVYLIFMIAVPKNSNNLHLDVLARLSTILMNEDFRDKLINCSDTQEFINLIDEKEREKFPEQSTSSDEKKSVYRVLAVTACPTGIAHTYMAAESLEEKAKKMNISIKVETNGSGGAKNVLTDEEIENAECIIIAADKNVEMKRFDGKKMIKCPVADGISKAEQLLNDAVSGKGAVYHYSGSENSHEESTSDNESIGRQIYKHLMNGVSHMLPFVIGGGIIIALAFLLDNYSINPANFGKNTPVAAVLKTIGENAFGFMLPVLAGYIAMSIADRPGLVAGFVGGALANLGITFQNAFDDKIIKISSGFIGALIAGFLAGYLLVAIKKLCSYLPKALEGIKPVLLYPLLGVLLTGLLIIAINPVIASINTSITLFLNSLGGTSKILLGAIVGGMMSIDMGGPFNKAAYVFGTASLASGNFDIMAAVMAGGMVPPLAIALCSTFFKNRFTTKERQSGLTNYVMGLSFITEGAIPFAAADPIRVLPSCIAGSALAGALSMFFGCTLRAPHGGIFVLPVIGNPFGFLLALIAGSALGMIILAFLKKPVNE